MVSRTQVWRLTARCPACGSAVRLRNTAHAMRMLDHAKADPQIADEDVIQTYQCARKHPDGSLCNELVEIKLRHWKVMS